MERFFILDKFNTWYDWRLILTAKNITPPEPKTNYIEIDGMSGTLDLSESLTGEVTYKDRTLTASFWTDEGNIDERAKLLLKITSELHGRKIKIVEPDDPDHYFYGRIKVKSTSNNLAYSTIDIEADCDPWRYAINEIERLVPLANKSVDVVIINRGVKTICPTIIVTNASVKVTYNNNDYYIDRTLTSLKITDIKLKKGVNVIRVALTNTYESNPSMSFRYQEADL